MLQYDPETVDSLSGQQMIMMTRLGAACTHAHGVVHGSPHRPEQACAGPPDVSASSEKRYEESDEFEDIASSWVIIDARALSPSSASSASLVMSTSSHPLILAGTKLTPPQSFGTLAPSPHPRDLPVFE